MQRFRASVCLSVIFSLSIAAQAIINTYAGGPPPSGLALQLPLPTPDAIATDNGGNVYIAVAALSTVYKLDFTHNLARIAGNGTPGFTGDNETATGAQLFSPVGVAVDNSGNIYIADGGNYRIRMIAASTKVITTVAGNGAAPPLPGAQLSPSNDGPALQIPISPSALAVDGSGAVYFVDGARVRKLVGGMVTSVAGNGAGGHTGDNGPATSARITPYGVAVTSSGTIYIPESNYIRQVTSGTIVTIAGTGVNGFGGDNGLAVNAALSYARSIAIDNAGAVYIADTNNYRVRKISDGFITTVAGQGVFPFNGDGPALITNLDPYSVALDTSGNLLIADRSNNRIRKLASGAITTIAGNGSYNFFGDGGPATSAALGLSMGVNGLALDTSGNLYFVDPMNHRVRKVTPAGAISTVAGNGTPGYNGDGITATAAQLNLPAAVAVDAAGTIYIADSGNNRIRQVSLGTITTLAGSSPGFSGDIGAPSNALLFNPQGVSVAANGNIYIADTLNHRIRVISNGIIDTLASPSCSQTAYSTGPMSVAVDNGSGAIYSVQDNCVAKILGSTVQIIAGGANPGFGGDNGLATSALLYMPASVSVDGAGNVYVADSLNLRVRKIAGSTITTVAGSGQNMVVPPGSPMATIPQGSFSGDGLSATAASLGRPTGVVADSAGNFYIADSGNFRVRVVSAAGQLVAVSVTTSPAIGLPIVVDGTSYISPQTFQWLPGSPHTLAVDNVVSSLPFAQYSFASWSNAGSRSQTITASMSTTYTAAFNVKYQLNVSPVSLSFGTSGSLISGAQQITLQTGPGVAWTSASSQPNIGVAPTSGIGSGTLLVTARPGPSGTVTISAPNALNPSVVINVAIASSGSSLPFGSFDTPVDGTGGIAGSIPVTGWALDKIQITKVDVWREPVPNEPAQSNGLIYIGDAVLVKGARPDVAATYPTMPFSDSAGWGYMLLTSQLPNNGGSPGLGNGTYKVHAIAHNQAGMLADLGTKTIRVDNAHATKPFGTLDTPAQGGTVSGNAYLNFGWALTQNPFSIPTDGSTITVIVDGQPVGHPNYNQFRGDIAAIFPGLANSNGAVGFFYLDTTRLTNGVHNIAWVVYDGAGRSDGIGSRYFTVQNSGGVTAPDSLPTAPASQDDIRAETEELGRVEIPVGATGGYMLAKGARLPLPVGSSLKGGIFYWQVGLAFLGEYQLVFERPDSTETHVGVLVRPQRGSVDRER